MAILTQSGRAAIAQSVKDQVIHIAWGQGQLEAGHDDFSPEDPMQTTLQSEVGRRIVDGVVFCVGDDNGELVTPTGRFSASEEPTNNLYIETTYDFEDASDHTIRELGLFVGTKTDPDLPVGQKYFLPADIVDPGILLLLEHSVPLIRTPATREKFCFVVTF
ncbi:hypothetical protein FACS1894122_05430 [Alphaproteobacteria bacterium]|nr:hypothetical protein FACS1894122_05430 [Alphaproteobacteria bacterium]